MSDGLCGGEGSEPGEALRSEGDINRSPRRAAWTREIDDARTRELLEKDARYFLHQSLSTPCLDALQSAQGVEIKDFAGRCFLDFHGNNVHHVGYGHPRVVEAVRRQMDELPFAPRRFTNEPAVALAKKLVDLAPGDLDRVLLAPGGTSAIGMAIKLARAATGRFKTISMWDSFHGASLDAISIGGESVFRKDAGPLLPGCEHVPPPDSYHCVFGCGGDCSLRCAEYIDYVLEKEGDVCAVIAETVRSTPYVPVPDYWRIVREACDRHGALLILDEIPHGLGRTGRMFSCEHYDLVPDMLVVGKALGGGIFPLAALIAREGLNVAADRALGHYTHEKSPVGCAAALATIGILEDEGLVENARRVGDLAQARLREMAGRYELIGDVRGLGLLIGVELVRDRASRERAVDEAERVMYESLSRGLSFKVSMGNVLTLTPALTITPEQMTQALDILEESIALTSSSP